MPANTCYKHIIWDWNGTLLNDVDIAIDAMNSLLDRRKLPLLDIEKYKEIVVFPICDYYAQLGFDFSKEPFEDLANEFISEINSDKYSLKLHDGVKEVLNLLRDMEISQSILSACKEEILIEAISELNISDYFFRIAGLNNNYAISKVKRGKDLLYDLRLNPEEVLLIGDTVHDYEVSQEIGCDCLLVSNGHQSFQRLSNCSTNIVNTIDEVVDFINGENIVQIKINN